jgi:hypothetical protein
MADIGQQSGGYEIERHFDALGEEGYHVVNFRYLKLSPHDEAGGQLIAYKDSKNRIAVEMRASTWNPDPPSRGTYCEAARTIIGPILKKYNRTYSTRHRFRIEKAPGHFVKISMKTGEMLNRFAVLANKSSLHPLDWKRFYEFVRKSRQELPNDQLSSLLAEKGFSGSYAEHLAEIYEHLWAFKRLEHYSE